MFTNNNQLYKHYIIRKAIVTGRWLLLLLVTINFVILCMGRLPWAYLDCIGIGIRGMCSPHYHKLYHRAVVQKCLFMNQIKLPIWSFEAACEAASHRTKKRICIKFALCKYVASMSFAQLCTQCKCGNGRICPFLCKFGHCHLCTGCKALQISFCNIFAPGKFGANSIFHPVSGTIDLRYHRENCILWIF